MSDDASDGSSRPRSAIDSTTSPFSSTVGFSSSSIGIGSPQPQHTQAQQHTQPGSVLPASPGSGGGSRSASAPAHIAAPAAHGLAAAANAGRKKLLGKLPLGRFHSGGKDSILVTGGGAGAGGGGNGVSGSPPRAGSTNNVNVASGGSSVERSRDRSGSQGQQQVYTPPLLGRRETSTSNAVVEHDSHAAGRSVGGNASGRAGKRRPQRDTDTVHSSPLSVVDDFVPSLHGFASTSSIASDTPVFVPQPVEISKVGRAGPVLVAERSQTSAFLILGLEVTHDAVSVSGYRLYAVCDWLLDTSHVFWTCVEKTGQPSDTITCSVLDLVSTTTAQQRQLVQLLFNPPPGADCASDETDFGSLLFCRDFQDFQQSHRLLQIPGPQSDFANYAESLTWQLTLFRLHCTDSDVLRIESEDIERDGEQQFCVLYSSYVHDSGSVNSNKIRTAARQIISEVQRCLTLVGLFEGSQEGEFTSETVAAVKQFQFDYNALESGRFELETTGRINPATLAECFTRLESFARMLAAIGFKATPPRPEQSLKPYASTGAAEAFVEAVQTFQSSRSGAQQTGSQCSGICDSVTVAALESDYAAWIARNSPLANAHSDVESDIASGLKRELGRLGDFGRNQLPLTASSEILTKISNSELLRLLAGRRFAVIEKRHAELVWSKTIPGLLIEEETTLVGYRLCIVEDGVLDDLCSEYRPGGETGSFYARPCFRVIATGNVEDGLRITPVVIPAGLTIKQAHMLRSRLLLVTDHPDDFFTETTRCGLLAVFAPRDTRVQSAIEQSFENGESVDVPQLGSYRIAFVPVLDGDFDLHIRDLQMQLSLRRLGAGHYPLSHLRDSQHNAHRTSLDEKFRGLYGISHSLSLEEAVFQFVRQLQAALALLHFFSDDLVAQTAELNGVPWFLRFVDGTYGRATCDAVALLQKEAGIPETCFLNGRTYEAIFQRIMSLKAQVDSTGFSVPTEDPFSDYVAFGSAVLAFEAAGYYAKRIQHRLTPPPQTVREDSTNNLDLSGVADSGSQQLMVRPSLRKVPQFTSMTSGLEQAVRKFQEQNTQQRPALRRAQDRLSDSVPNKATAEVAAYEQALTVLKQDAEAGHVAVAHAEQRLQGLVVAQTRLERERDELSDSLRHYERELEDMRKQYNNLAREYSHTCELMREHVDTIASYRDMIKRLQAQVQKLQRSTRYRNVLTTFLTSLLTWVLSILAVLILTITTLIDFGRRQFVRLRGTANVVPQDDDKTTRSVRRALVNAKRTWTGFAEEFDVVESDDAQRAHPPLRRRHSHRTTSNSSRDSVGRPATLEASDRSQSVFIEALRSPSGRLTPP